MKGEISNLQMCKKYFSLFEKQDTLRPSPFGIVNEDRIESDISMEAIIKALKSINQAQLQRMLGYRSRC